MYKRVDNKSNDQIQGGITMNYILFKKGLPALLLVNCMMLIYAVSRTKNTGDAFWYILTIIVNIAFMAAHELSLPHTHTRDKRRYRHEKEKTYDN